MWLFGRGLPDAGKDLGIEVESGVDAGDFGTERFSRLETREGEVYFDVKLNEKVVLPPDTRVCGVRDDVFLLASNADDSKAPKAYLWRSGGTPEFLGDGGCSDLGESHVMIGRRVFSWKKKAIVGDITLLCDDDECSAVRYRPVLDAGYVLLAPKEEARADLDGIERTLRTSLGSGGELTLAQTGPLYWKAWATRKSRARTLSARRHGRRHTAAQGARKIHGIAACVE